MYTVICFFFNENKSGHDTASEFWHPGTMAKEVFGSGSPEIGEGRLHLRISPRQVVQALVEAA